MLPERRGGSLPRGKIHRAESTFHGMAAYRERRGSSLSQHSGSSSWSSDVYGEDLPEGHRFYPPAVPPGTAHDKAEALVEFFAFCKMMGTFGLAKGTS